MESNFTDIGAPKPRVKADAESSSPIFTQDTISGTRRYSTVFHGFEQPKEMPLIFIASAMALYSFKMVGKKRKTTESVIVIWVGTRMRSIAAINSLIFVELSK